MTVVRAGIILVTLLAAVQGCASEGTVAPASSMSPTSRSAAPTAASFAGPLETDVRWLRQANREKLLSDAELESCTRLLVRNCLTEAESSDRVAINATGEWLCAELETAARLHSDGVFTDTDLARFRAAVLARFNGQKPLGR